MSRLTFLSHFVICLACAALAFFAWNSGVLLQGWDEPVVRWAGSAIGITFVSGVVWLGWQAWLADSTPVYFGLDSSGRRVEARPSASSAYGDLLMLICPAIGLVGTVSGLGVVFAHLGDQAALASGGAQAFYSTRFGMVAMTLIAIMAYSLECGIKKDRR